MQRTAHALLATAALASAGCAEIRLRTTPHVLDETLLRTRRETVVGPELTADVDQVGTQVTVLASRSCSEHAMRDVRRTLRYGHYDVNAADTRRLGIAGGAIGAAGVLITSLAAIPKKTDVGADLGFGIPTAALGTTLAIAAIIGVARAASHDETVEDKAVDDGAVSAATPCLRRRPAGDAAVVGQPMGMKTLRVPLGRTGDDGIFHLDLTHLPQAALDTPEPHQLRLYVDETAVGVVSFAAVANEADDRAYTEAQEEGCLPPYPAAPCWRFHRYLSNFLHGRHVTEARAAIDAFEAHAAENVKAAAARAKEEERLVAAEARRRDRASAAGAAARAAAATTCRLTCRSKCQKDAACAAECAAQSCFGTAPSGPPD
jgi:hypothetical protein